MNKLKSYLKSSKLFFRVFIDLRASYHLLKSSLQLIIQALLVFLIGQRRAKKLLIKHGEEGLGRFVYLYLLQCKPHIFSDQEVQKLIAKKWEAPWGAEWSRTKYQQTEKIYSHGLNTKRYFDTYYPLYSYFEKHLQPLKQRTKIVELGCGGGHLLKLLAPNSHFPLRNDWGRL